MPVPVVREFCSFQQKWSFSASLTMTFPLKIINAGMYRGGTASLSMALNKLGFGPTWHLLTNSEEKTEQGAKWWIDNNVTNRVHQGEYVNFDEWLQLIQCSSIMDTPIVRHWDKIFEQYPNCKVILSARDFEKWWKSFEFAVEQCWSDSFLSKTDLWAKDIIKQTDLYTESNGYNMKEILMMDESQRKHIFKKDFYDKDIEKVKQMVPKEQLLIFDVDQGWKPLCEFLNVDIPNTAFPKTNDREGLSKFLREMGETDISCEG